MVAVLAVPTLAGFVLVGLGLSRTGLESPDPTVLLRDRHGQFLGETGGTDARGFGYWPLDTLPERVVAATLAAEDHRFWEHPGVDPRAVGRALWQNLSNRRRISGASTLAMQVARMQNPGRRTYARKATEAVAALGLTARHGRDAVLRHYLRLVPYGNQIHGIAYAARRYLDKPVDDLSWAEVAFLAAIPQAPARTNPFDPHGRLRAVKRGQWILGLLHDSGDLPTGEYELAMEQIERLRIPHREARPASAMHAVLALGRAFEQPDTLATVADHPVVTTTLDLELQNEVTWKVHQRLKQWERRGAGNGAAVVLDRTSREVLAWVGSANYFDDTRAGAIDYARVSRSPGSTLKPFFFALALDRGVITPATVLDDLERGAGGIGNADERFLGPLLPRVALANSRNVPAANLLARIGLDDGFDFLHRLGLHDGRQTADRYGLGLSLGGLPVTLERLMGAYTALANGGELGDLVWYQRQPSTEARRVLSEDAARQVSLFLSDPMARLPTFPRMGSLEYPFPVAVKTGTSSNYHDAWAVGYTHRYQVGVWVGHPDHRPMAELSGYRAAAQLLRDIVLHLHPDDTDGLGDVGFPPPRGHRGVRLCALTGRLATPATDHVVVEYFRPGDEPTEPSQAHVRRAVDRRNGLLATEATPRDAVEVRIFVDLGPRYAAWQSQQGLPRPPRLSSRLGGAAHVLQGAVAPEPTRLVDVDVPVTLNLTAPEAGLRILVDPEAPADRSTLALRVTVDPPVEQVVWYVDGEPFEVVDYPYTTRWPIVPGEHTFQARLPFRDGASKVVTVTVY